MLVESIERRAMNEEHFPRCAPSATLFVFSNALGHLSFRPRNSTKIQSQRSRLNRGRISFQESFTVPRRRQRNRFLGPFLTANLEETKPVEILSLTDSWVAVNKPAGMLVHRTKLYHSNPNETYLVDHVSHLVSERKGFEVSVKPVQRLDRPTSGVMVFALGDSKSAARLQATLQSPDTQKVYWAIASGADMPTRWINEHPLTDLTGKHRKQRSARTEIHQLARLNTSNISVVSARISSGRRHQIRRHLSNSRHPILGDTSYGKGDINRHARENYGATRCCLHAWHLTFQDSETSETVRLEVPIPEDLRRVLQRFPDFDSALVTKGWNDA